MAIDRKYINQLVNAKNPAHFAQVVFQALSGVADSIDTLHSAVGIQPLPGVGNGTGAPTPSSPSLTVSGGSGQLNIGASVAQPTGINPAVQHHIQVSSSATFQPQQVQDHYLGYGQQQLQLVMPNSKAFVRARSRTLGSGWSKWTVYSTAAGVSPVSTGAL